MKFRIQIQQIYGGNWATMEEATEKAEWLQKDDIKPRSRKQAAAALEAQANLYKNGAPHRLVMISPSGSWEVLETITRGTACFTAAPVVKEEPAKVPAMQTMAKRFPINDSYLAPFAFAGFQWPRYVATLPKGSKAKRLERYKSASCGPYYHAPKPVEPGSDHGTGFYLNTDGMPGMRWTWCDEVEGVTIRHTGWFADTDGHGDKIRGIVFRLPSGRGFLAGYSMGDGMSSGINCHVHDTEVLAAYAADDEAQYVAEKNRDYQEEQEALAAELEQE